MTFSTVNVTVSHPLGLEAVAKTLRALCLAAARPDDLLDRDGRAKQDLLQLLHGLRELARQDRPRVAVEFDLVAVVTKGSSMTHLATCRIRIPP